MSDVFQCVDCGHTKDGYEHTWNGYPICYECGGLMNQVQKDNDLIDFNGRNQIIKKG